MKFRFALPVTLALAAALAGCGGSASSPSGSSDPGQGSGGAAAATVTVVTDPATIGAFTPQEVSIKAGQTVLWKFDDINPHTVTSDTNMGNYSSQPSAKGKEFRHTFAAAGTFKYHCAIHPEMLGTVTVS